MKIRVINGPNLNLLGRREPGIYGSRTLDDIEARVRARGVELGVTVEWLQSNHEGVLVESIQGAGADDVDALIVNAAAYTHTSVAIRDALLAAAIPFVEVHLSQVAAREAFRQTNLIADIATGTITGLGAHGYVLALEALKERHETQG